MKGELVKKLIIQIEACLRDKARSFSVGEVETEDCSRSTVYRYIRELRSIGVLEKKGREQYTVSDKFRREVVKERRGFL